MTHPRWRTPGIRLAPLAAAALLLVALPLAEQSLRPDADVGPYATLEPARLDAQHGRRQLELRVTSASQGYEDALHAKLAERFAGHVTNVELVPGVVVPDYWNAATLETLAALATLESGSAIVEPDSITLRGVATDGANWNRRLRALQELLPAYVRVVDNVMLVATAEPVDDLCRDAFTAFRDVQIPFEQASAELRTAAHGTLDRIVEFAFDCRDTTIVVTGHTDALGDEAWNQRLSLLRAAAVVTYLARSGVDPGRLHAVGVGSSQPVADNETAYGRNRNRRIEFTLR